MIVYCAFVCLCICDIMVVIVICSLYTEIRFQAELQLVLDISRAEQEPVIAQQEHANSDCLSLNHQLDTMAMSNVNNNEQHSQQSTGHGYHGDYESIDDDYIDLPGAHRRSPVFI